MYNKAVTAGALALPSRKAVSGLQAIFHSFVRSNHAFITGHLDMLPSEQVSPVQTIIQPRAH